MSLAHTIKSWCAGAFKDVSAALTRSCSVSCPLLPSQTYQHSYNFLFIAKESKVHCGINVDRMVRGSCDKGGSGSKISADDEISDGDERSDGDENKNIKEITHKDICGSWKFGISFSKLALASLRASPGSPSGVRRTSRSPLSGIVDASPIIPRSS
jgi:hypothetical protein